MQRRRSERGAALVEAAVTIPILLLIAVGIFEFGRAYQHWQVLTNAAREGARYSVTPGATSANVDALVREYMKNGGLPKYDVANVQVVRNVALAFGTASTITIGYPFDFIVLQPVANMIKGGAGISKSVTMAAAATMRNESP
jgi:Flp pilus assembly protein TadG